MPTPIDLSFTDANGHAQTMHVVAADGHGWQIRALLDGRIFTRDCSDWQRVERTRRWLRSHAHETTPVAAARPGWVATFLVAAVAALGLLPGNADAQVIPETHTIMQFQRAVDDYAFLHRRLERRLAPAEVTADAETLRAAIDTMAATMRSARPDARQGDLFSPAVGAVLRVRIARALFTHGFSPADVLAAEVADRLDHRPLSLKVNEAFPWAIGAAVFPCVLEALPALPPELQYRIVGADLVLIDVHAGLVIDVLPFALADSDDPFR